MNWKREDGGEMEERRGYVKMRPVKLLEGKREKTRVTMNKGGS